MSLSSLGSHERHALHRVVLGTVLLVFLLSGCRTYGGWGSEEANFEQIVQANLNFADELQEMEREVERLREAATQQSDLEPFVERYENVLQLHEQKLAEHQLLEERAALQQDSHRTLHRIFITIVVDQQLMRNRYDRLLGQVRSTLTPEEEEGMVVAVTPQARGIYQIAPPFYQRLARAGEARTLSEVLGQLVVE